MIIDQTLMTRIEDAIVAERSAFVDGMAALQPALGATWLDVAGGRAIFTGASFFSNRAMGMGLHGPVRQQDVEGVETFFAEHGVASEIEMASMVDRSLLRLLNQRGYGLIRFRNIYAQVVRPSNIVKAEPTASTTAIEVYEVDDARISNWSNTLLDGFGYTDAVDRDRVAMWNRMLYSRPEATALMAVINDEPVGSASVMILGATAVLGGAATLPTCRRQGVQRALIEARLSLAARAGCKLAVMTADPGSSSGRNAERSGFQLVCNHVGMRRSSP